jgi:hypothetical protein
MPGRASLLVAVRPAGVPQQEQKPPCDLLDAGQEARIDLLVCPQEPTSWSARGGLYCGELCYVPFVCGVVGVDSRRR